MAPPRLSFTLLINFQPVHSEAHERPRCAPVSRIICSPHRLVHYNIGFYRDTKGGAIGLQ